MDSQIKIAKPAMSEAAEMARKALSDALYQATKLQQASRAQARANATPYDDRISQAQSLITRAYRLMVELGAADI